VIRTNPDRRFCDHAAGSPLRPEAAEAMAVLGWLANPSATHTSGRRARAALEDARERLAACVGSRPDEVVWTSCATESNNLAITGTVRARAREGRDGVVVTALDHAASLRPAAASAAVTRVVPARPEGLVDTRAWAAAQGDGTALASLCWVNNVTGAVQPVAELAGIAAERGAWVHTDAAQALGRVAVDVAASGVDLLTLSSHKVGGPAGIAALVVRRSAEVVPLLRGGGQEGGLRSGTPAVALAVGFAVAAEAAVAQREAEEARQWVLRRRLVDGVSGLGGVRVISPAEVVPGIVCLTVEGCRGDDLTMLLDAAGIDCSAGAACSAGVHRPSETLLAMGLDAVDAAGALRFSFGWSSTVADVDEVVAALPAAIERARLAFA